MGPVDLAKNFRICLSQLLMNIPPGSSSKPVGAHYFIQAGGVSGYLWASTSSEVRQPRLLAIVLNSTEVERRKELGIWGGTPCLAHELAQQWK